MASRTRQNHRTLTIAQILSWADEHHRLYGVWPKAHSLEVAGVPDETWQAINSALLQGARGLPYGSSLGQLLEQHRGTRTRQSMPRLTVRQILAWADTHRKKHGDWPKLHSAMIEGAHGETWRAVDRALRMGRRGLRVRTTLAKLLSKHRKKRDPRSLTRLTIQQILAWADEHRRRSGEWPLVRSGPIRGSGGETWKRIQMSLYMGYRGLPPRNTLARLLAKHRGVRNMRASQRLTIARILSWADSHYRRTDQWPRSLSGPVADAPGETWRAIDAALARGGRGLSGGTTLAQLLTKRRRQPVRSRKPPLTGKLILAWADDHFRRHGAWPTSRSGRVMAAPGEDWRSISETLSTGGRGLPQRMSLPALITLHGNPGLRNRKERRLSVAQILVWADRYHRRWKRWPTRLSGSIQGSRGETWQGLDYALQYGTRGLAGGSSLSRTLTAHRDLRRGYKLPKLSIGTILQWADAHHRRTGTWPVVSGTPIPESPGDTWHRVASALVFGNRGLPGGMSLAQLLAKHRGKRNAKRLPSLTIEQILAWADAYFRRKGAWPNAYKGEVIPKSRGETWLRVHNALAEGLRGLPGGSSLARLLAEQREVRTRRYSPRLTENRILQWADAHYKRWKTWPTRSSGVVDDDPTESWDRIDSALKSGLRGLQTNSSLCKLLARYRR